LTQLLRLCVTGSFNPQQSVPGLRKLLSSAAGTPDIDHAEALLADTQAEVARIFDRLVAAL
jgi:glutamate-ammonia-ligase adenylyltransferase